MKFTIGREAMNNVQEIESDRIVLGEIGGKYIEIKIVQRDDGIPSISVRSDRQLSIEPKVSNEIEIQGR